MIQPALSAEEWANHRGFDRTDHAPGLDGGHNADLYLELEPGAWVEVGHPYVRIHEPRNIAALAALCLHGRISWGMIDALDEAIGALEYSSVVRRPEPHLVALSELIQSLLPPRAT